MSEYKEYLKIARAEMRPYVDGEDMENIMVNTEDVINGSPKEGDMIARNPKNHADQWLVSAKFFAENYEEIT